MGSPSLIFWRTVRGMLPIRTKRGQTALKKLNVYEGIPPAYATKNRLVVVDALRVQRLKQSRPFTRLERLSAEFGWAHKDLIHRLEDNRKVTSKKFYMEKAEKLAKERNATKTATSKL